MPAVHALRSSMCQIQLLAMRKGLEMASDLKNFYDEKYVGGVDLRTIRRSAWPRTRDEAVVGALVGGKNYLEIGAGDGSVAAAARPHFESVTLVEISSSRGSALTESFAGDAGFRVVVADIEDGYGPVNDKIYDVVVMNAVIEHLVDPCSALAGALEVMPVGGTLLITTPNIAKWTRRTKLVAGRFPSTASRNEGLERYEGGPTTLYDEGHLHYFTYRSLAAVLSRAGFAKVEPLWFGRPVVATRIMPKLFSDCFVRAFR